ncbi:MAG: GDSL-type esterase/lipase family protein [Cyanobacteria bacterium P01_G01_bin.54]
MLSKQPLCLVLLIFITALLGISVTSNFLLFKRAKLYYLELNKTRLDPAELSYYTHQDLPQKKGDRPRVIFFGDSRAESWLSPESEAYEWFNRGIAGQTAVQTSQRFAAHVEPLHPDVVVVQVGINDLKTIALFPERRDEIVANCLANIRRIVVDAQRIGSTVIVTTIFPTGEIPLARRPFWSDKIEGAITQVNGEILTLAGEQVIVLDSFQLLAGAQRKLPRNYQKDELHLKPMGYAPLNQALLTALEKSQY